MLREMGAARAAHLAASTLSGPWFSWGRVRARRQSARARPQPATCGPRIRRTSAPRRGCSAPRDARCWRARPLQLAADSSLRCGAGDFVQILHVVDKSEKYIDELLHTGPRALLTAPCVDRSASRE